jgi:hypothetical protein
LSEHRYQCEAEKDVPGRKHHVLPATVADLRKQILNCEHRLPPPVKRHTAETLNPLCGQNHIGSSEKIFGGFSRLRVNEMGEVTGISWVPTAVQAQPTRRINEIIVGDDRFRKDMGDILALAARIVELGLLHPIVIRPDAINPSSLRRT